MSPRILRISLIVLPIAIVGMIGLVFLSRHKAAPSAVSAFGDDKPEVYVQTGHAGRVLCCDWSPDGKLIASGDGDGIIKILDISTDREVLALRAHPTGSVVGMAFRANGTQLVSAGTDSCIRLWDLASGKELLTLRLSNRIWWISLDRERTKVLAMTGDTVATLWELPSGKHLASLPTKKKLGLKCAAALSPDGRFAALSGAEKASTLVLWDVKSGRAVRTWQIEAGEPLYAEFSPDGSRLACGTGMYERYHWIVWRLAYLRVSVADTLDNSGIIYLWNVKDGAEVRRTVDRSGGVQHLRFLADRRQLLTVGLDSTFSVWDAESGDLVFKSPRYSVLLYSSCVSPDSRTAVISGYRLLSLWDLRRFSRTRDFAPATTRLSGLDFSAGETGALVGADSAVFLWSLTTGQRQTVKSPLAGGDTLMWCANMAVTALARVSNYDSKPLQKVPVRFWSLDKGLLGCTKEVCTFPGLVGQFSADGSVVLAQAEDSVLKVWNVATGKLIRRFTLPLPPKSLTVGEQRDITGTGGLALASLPGSDETYSLDILTGKQRALHSSSKVRFVSFVGHDGSQSMVITDSFFVELWDLKTDHLLRSYKLSDQFDRFCLSPDGSLLGTRLLYPGQGAAGRSTIGVFETQSGRKICELKGHTGDVKEIRICRDNRYLLSLSLDRTTRLWNIATGKEIIQFVSFQNGEWVAVTPEGYYTASVNGDAFLNVRLGTKVTGIEPYRSTFYQPKVVEAALRLGDSELAISEVLGCKTSCTTIADLPEMYPPVVVVKSPDDGDTLHATDATLAFHVEDQRNVIQSVKVYVNGRPVTGNPTRGSEEESLNRSIQLDIPRDKKLLDLKVPLRLDAGDNLITIAALGKSEAVDSLHVYVMMAGTLPEQMEMDTVWILAVGINKYQDKKLQSLKYCQNDAQGMIQAFQAQEGKTCQKVMSLCISDAGPKKPTYETIVDNIGFLQQAAEHDLVILFLAGHGVNDAHGDFYFLPSDAEVTGPQEFKKSKAISGAQLQTAVDVSARRFVFVDACHSEEMGVDLVKLAREFKDNRVLIMTSSEGTKPSEEADSLKHGLFTYALITGLQGAADITGSDGKVSAMELITYVSDRVTTMTKQRQNPVFWAPGGLSNFVVSIAEPQRGVVALRP